MSVWKRERETEREGDKRETEREGESEATRKSGGFVRERTHERETEEQGERGREATRETE